VPNEPSHPAGSPKVHPRSLSWSEVDPEGQTFDADSVHDVVRSLTPAAVVPVRPEGSAADDAVIRWSDEEGTQWADAMTVALVEHYGAWACGWRWSIGEADFDGGPVASWCCPRDSMTTPARTLEVVAASLLEWRLWLEELAERFARFLPLPSDAPKDLVLDTWERAVAHLVTVVVDRTRAESGWYGHCKRVLSWFLTAAGVPTSRHQQLIEDAIGGRFKSWSAPSNRTIANVAERLAATVVQPRDA
jgi:hypothetical protein